MWWIFVWLWKWRMRSKIKRSEKDLVWLLDDDKKYPNDALTLLMIPALRAEIDGLKKELESVR